MKPIRLSPQTKEQIKALDDLYRHSKDGRVRQRAHIVLLAAEQGMVALQTGSIVRLNEESVRRWLKRYEAEGIEGLKDDPRPGMAPLVTPEYRAQLVAAVRRRPRSLGQPFSLWTCQRLADYLAEETGIRVSDESVRRYLSLTGIVLSRAISHLEQSVNLLVSRNLSYDASGTSVDALRDLLQTMQTGEGCC